MDTDALAKRCTLPVLDRKNQKQWFELAITLLKSKGLYYVIEQDKIKYTWISGSKRTAQAKALEDSSKDSSTTNTPRSENNGYELVIRLNDFDQEFAAKFSSTKEKFDNLRLKYNKTCPINNRENLAKLTAFKLEEGVSLEEAWVQIKSLRTKVVNAQPSLKSTFKEEYIFNILMSALPAEYATTIDAIDAQPHILDAHKKLKKLQRKEEHLKAANTDNTVMLAKQFNKKRNAKLKGRKFSYSSDKDVEDSDNNGGDQKKGPNRGCYLCGGLHFYQDCKYGKEFMEFVKKEKREACCHVPARCSSQKTCGKKNKAYAADGNSGDNSSSSTSIASDNDPFDEEAQISRISVPNPPPKGAPQCQGTNRGNQAFSMSFSDISSELSSLPSTNIDTAGLNSSILDSLAPSD
ncbi:MAG: hypothetical protein FRX48_09763 [Lasallia pustulata]|uniref:Uncharacterized protein n=1 Tax=Lasallia pustulata TaxID=136370 RepID=A0A5M8PCJ9_9LECA|nr:MAG: hypothetical protein FRX48_09763 [Lasallia pustulata]